MDLTDYETDSNFEFEIEKIIQSIELKDIRTIEEINKLNTDILKFVYEEFLIYDMNKENLNYALNILKDNYEYVESIDELKHKDFVMGIRLSHFYNLKLKRLGFFFSSSDNKVCLGYFRGNKYNYNFDNYVFFRKLNSLDKTKLFLIKSIENE